MQTAWEHIFNLVKPIQNINKKGKRLPSTRLQPPYNLPSGLTFSNLDDPFIFYLHSFLQVVASILPDAFLNFLWPWVEWNGYKEVVNHLITNCSMRIVAAGSQKVKDKDKNLL